VAGAQQKHSTRYTQRAKPIGREELCKVARLLRLEAWRIWLATLGTDFDLVGVRRRRDVEMGIETVVVEAKAVLHEKNIQHAINQLYFRRHFFNRVYIATRGDSVWYALALVPNQFGVIDVSSMTIVRDSKLFVGGYHRYLKLSLLASRGGRGRELLT